MPRNIPRTLSTTDDWLAPMATQSPPRCRSGNGPPGQQPARLFAAADEPSSPLSPHSCHRPSSPAQHTDGVLPPQDGMRASNCTHATQRHHPPGAAPPRRWSHVPTVPARTRTLSPSRPLAPHSVSLRWPRPPPPPTPTTLPPPPQPPPPSPPPCTSPPLHPPAVAPQRGQGKVGCARGVPRFGNSCGYNVRAGGNAGGESVRGRARGGVPRSAHAGDGDQGHDGEGAWFMGKEKRAAPW